jgi:hypothetical protein
MMVTLNYQFKGPADVAVIMKPVCYPKIRLQGQERRIVVLMTEAVSTSETSVNF